MPKHNGTSKALTFNKFRLNEGGVDFNAGELAASLFASSNFILGTYDALSSVIIPASQYGWFSQVQTVIVDDAHSQLEVETLITLTEIKPTQLILMGSAELPRPLVHSIENC